MGYYDAAQICLNGHVITRSANRSPEFRQKHCKTCGEETIMVCPACSAPIRGDYHVEGFMSMGSEEPPPNFCHECGKSYPWTARRIAAARELADDFEEISLDEREKLKKTLDDIFTETPKTEVSASRFKRIMSKVGKESYDAMKSVITDVLSETAKKTILGG